MFLYYLVDIYLSSQLNFTATSVDISSLSSIQPYGKDSMTEPSTGKESTATLNQTSSEAKVISNIVAGVSHIQNVSKPAKVRVSL